jgi:RimJ/RimL family protein N-acetyltransferase
LKSTVRLLVELVFTLAAMFIAALAELGYWLGKDFWGRGIVTEAVAAFTDFCFQDFPLRRVYAEPFANNSASVRVLEKAGFVFEGRLKNNVVKDGELLDSLLYARTK